MRTLAKCWVTFVAIGLTVASIVYPPVAIVVALVAFCVITGVSIGYLIG